MNMTKRSRISADKAMEEILRFIENSIQTVKVI